MKQPTTLGLWLHGLVATAISGIGNGLSLVVANAAFDIFKDTKGLVTAVIASTIVSVAAYLKQSPLPYYDFEGGEIVSPVPNSPTDPLSSATKKLVSIAIALFLVGSLTSCVSPTTGKLDVKTTAESLKPYLRPISASIGSGIILVEKTPQGKDVRVEWLNLVSSVIQTASSKGPLSGVGLRDAMLSVTPSNYSDMIDVINSIVSLYLSFRAKSSSESQLLDALEEIAAGLKDATRPYAKSSSSNKIILPLAFWNVQPQLC